MPPPPPSPSDFQPQINQKRTELQNSLNSKADTYNSQVDAFNNSLSQLSNQYGDLHTKIGGLNMTNVDDNGASYRNQLDSLQKSLAGLTKPGQFNYQGTYTLPEYANATVTLENPQLHSLNTDLLNTLNTGYGSDSSLLTDMLNKRSKAESDYRNFFTGLNASAGSAFDTANTMDLAGYAGSGFDRSGYNNLASRLNNFTSDIAGDYNFAGEAGARDAVNKVKARYDALDALKTGEQGRINNYKTDLQNYLNNSTNTFNTLSIKDADKLKALDDELRSRAQGASQFSSPLSFDFSGLTNQYNSLDSSINNRLAERQRELDRIGSSQTSYANQAQNILGNANAADYYSQNNLQGLTNQINELQRQIGGFSSTLDYNFGDANKALTDAQKQVAALNTQRQAAMQDLVNRGAKFSTGLNDIPLYNENDFNSRLANENNLLAQLSQFTGGDVAGYRSQLATGQQAIADKLSALSDYRNNLEGQAKSLQSRFGNQSFYDTAAVDAARSGDFKKLLDEISLYGATQANDEASAIKSRLDSEYSRLQSDATAKAALAAKEAGSVNNVLGASQVYTINGIPLTAEEYAALMAQKQKESAAGASTNSAFLQALGLTG
jgi:hypothetical protein